LRLRSTTARNHATNLPDEAVAKGSMVRGEAALATNLDGEIAS